MPSRPFDDGPNVAARSASTESARPPADDWVAVVAPAKINLTLLVGPRLANGYHELNTVFLALDRVETVRVRAADRTSVRVLGPYREQVPVGAGNLATRAAGLLAERWTGGRFEGRTGGRFPVGPVEIEIDKTIPVAGGMAGGSADAAAALLACAELWGLSLGTAELLALATELGADVPFGLLGGCALGTGRGDLLTALTATPTHWAIATSPTPLATSGAFARLDQLRATGRLPEPAPGWDDSSTLRTALAAGDPARLAGLLRNDLAAVALDLQPGLAAVLAAGRDLGALTGMVSGSGPSLAFLCADQAAAAAVAAGLRTRQDVAETFTASGPAPGARVAAPEPTATKSLD